MSKHELPAGEDPAAVEESAGSGPPAPAQPASRWLAAGVIIAVTAASIWIALNPALVLGLGRWGYTGAFILSLVASASIILPIPALAVVMAMGASLNPLLLGIITGVGSAIGELSGYLAGSSGRMLVSQDQASHYARLERWTRKYGAFGIFLVAALPVPLFDLAGIAAGAIRMPVWQFVVATALGKTVKYTIAILLGAGSVRGLRHFFE